MLFIIKKIFFKSNVKNLNLVLVAFLFFPIFSTSQSCKEIFERPSLSHKRYDSKSLKIAMNSTNYKKLIYSYPKLSVEDEKALFTLYKKGDERAFQILFLSNLHHIAYIIKRHKEKHYYDDLFQESVITLLKSFETFDTNKAEFKYYLKQAITRKVILYVEEKVDSSHIRWNPNRHTIYKAFRDDLKSADFNFNIQSWIHKFHKKNPNFSKNDINAIEMFISSKHISYQSPIRNTNSTIDNVIPDKINVEEEVMNKEHIEKIYLETKTHFPNEVDQVILEKRIFTDTPQTLHSLDNDLPISHEAIRLRQKKMLKYIHTNFPR